MTEQVQKIFIVGSSRSGTTMMSRILGNHSAIFSFNELHFFEQVILPNNFSKALTGEEARQAYSKLLNIQRNGLFNFLTSKNKAMEEAATIAVTTAQETGEIVFDSFLAYEVKRSNKQIACEQTPTNIFYIQNIMNAYPNALFIHMVRDPRGVLLSQKNRWRRRFKGAKDIPLRQSMRNYANYHPVTNGLLWKASVNKAMAFENDKRFTTIKFEDLLSDAEKTIKDLCSFIGVPYQSKMLEIPQVGSSNNKDEGDKKGIRESVKDQWKNGGLTNGEIYINQLVTKEAMQKMQYEPMPFKSMPASGISTLLLFPVKIGFSFLLNVGRVKNIRQVIMRRLKK